MDYVIFMGFVVGGATMLGGLLGLIYKRQSGVARDAMLSFAAGVMLSAAIIGLILPSVEEGVAVAVVGIFLGALFVNLLDLPLPYLMKRRSCEDDALRRVILFVMAIALHNLPEGIAAGVGIGGGDGRSGVMISLAIAMQNIPEGVIVTVSLRGVGVRGRRAFLISALTGVIEILGTLLGYLFAAASEALLPLILAVAGGTMLYVIGEEMIPESHSSGSRLSTYFLLFGFSFMLILNALLKNL